MHCTNNINKEFSETLNLVHVNCPLNHGYISMIEKNFQKGTFSFNQSSWKFNSRFKQSNVKITIP